MRASWLVGASMSWIATGACSDAQPPSRTRVVVEIHADSALEASAATLLLEIAALEGDRKLTKRRERVTPDWPLRRELAPEGDDPNRKYVVSAGVVSSSDALLASLALQSGYVRDETRFVRLRLESGCRNSAPLERSPRRFGSSPASALEVASCEPPTLPETPDASVPGMDASPPPHDAADPEPVVVDAAPEAAAPSCDPGFDWIEGRCQAIDPCRREPKRCEDTCEVGANNTAICSCKDGGVVKPHDTDQCWRWGSAVALETSDVSVDGSNLAMNPSGVAIAVWFEGEPPAVRVWANRFQPGMGWRGPIALTADAGGYVGFHADRNAPVVAVDNDGNGLVIFAAENTTALTAVLLRSDEWQSRVLASPGNAHRQTAWVKRDPQGGFYVLSASGGLDIASWWLRHYTRDGDWSGTIPLPAPDGVSFRYAALGVAEAARSLALLWSDTQGRVWGSRLEFVPPYALNTREVPGSSNAAGDLGVALDAQGTMRAVWRSARQDDLALANLYSSTIFALATRWSEPARMSMQVDVFELSQTILDRPDSTTSAWIQRDEVGSRLFSDRGQAALDRMDQGDSSTLDLASDFKGNVLVVWSRFLAGHSDVLVARHDRAAWSEPRALNDGLPGDAKNPRVVSDRNGDALVIWEQQLEGKRSLWAKRFE